MSKENDKSKTSKTARVMNLLSKKHEEPVPAPEEASAAPAAVSEAAAPTAPVENAAPLSPILSMAPDAAVSVQIKNALEDALESELTAKAAPAVPEPPAQPADPAPQEPAAAEIVPPEPEIESAVETAPEPEPVGEPAPVMETPVPEAPVAADPVVVPAPAPVSTVSVQVETEEAALPGYINVMQVLVEEKAPKYMKMFGICTCPQCQEDVKALALNNLPPKYVVLGGGDRIPKLTFYEGQYSSDITAQLLKACTVVMQTPHHDR